MMNSRPSGHKSARPALFIEGSVDRENRLTPAKGADCYRSLALAPGYNGRPQLAWVRTKLLAPRHAAPLFYANGARRAALR